jgi:hypothetical protein
LWVRSLLLPPLACIPFLLVAACVGDDPALGSGTSPGVDAGEDRATPGTDGAPNPDANIGDTGGGQDQEAGPPACNLIQVSTLTGTGAPGLVEGPGATAKFDGSEGITAGPDGTLFVADSNNKRVRKVLSDGTTSTFAVDPVKILSAFRVAYRNGDIYMIDRTDDALRRITPGAPPQISTVIQIGALAAVGTSPAGSIYVSQTQNCYLSKVTGNTSALFSGDMVGCGNADGAAAVARFSNNILDIGFDGSTAMYVVDAGNFRIRKVSEANGSVTTLAGSTQGHADGAGSAAKFEDPTALTVDPQSHIVYVADKTTIRAITPAGVVTTLLGSTSGFDDGSGCTAKFGDLRGITYYAGALYAVDVNRVRKVKLP